MDEIDGGRAIDWGKTSPDYARYRPGYPDGFFRRLETLGIGLAGQRILDLGTGTGVLARRFARQGCAVVGVDVAPAQLAAGRRLAADEGVRVEFRLAPAERTGLRDGVVDVVTAGQCWHYFDPARAIPEVRRVLAPGGRLVISSLDWLPRSDPVAAASEAVVLRHNPQWTGGDDEARVPAIPAWAVGQFDVAGVIAFDEALPFTRESWRGRFRACRATGATLDEEELRRFDEEHAAILEQVTAGPRFTVLHRVWAHVLEPS